MRPIRGFKKLLSIPMVALLMMSATKRTATADAIDDALTTSSAATVSLIPACKGIPVATQKSALHLIKSDVCTDFAQLLTGTQTGKQIGTDIQAIFTDLQVNLSVTPLCAASLMGVFAQKIIKGEVSAGLCPAGS